MITGTNQSKNIVSPVGQVKGYARQAIYGVGIYGLATYGIGISGFGIKTNQNKTSTTKTTTTIGRPVGLLLALTSPVYFSIGVGGINQSKS